MARLLVAGRNRCIRIEYGGLELERQDPKRDAFDRCARVVEDLALVSYGIDGSVGVPKEDLFGSGLRSLASPLQVAGDLVEHLLVRVCDVSDESVDTGFDYRIVESVSDRVRAWAVFVGDTASIEQLMEIGFVRNPRIDDIAVEKDAAV